MAKKPKYRVYKVTIKVKSDSDSNWRLVDDTFDRPWYFMSLTDARNYMRSVARAVQEEPKGFCGAPKGSAAKGEYTWTLPGYRRDSIEHYKMELFELTGTAAKRFFIKQVKEGYYSDHGFYYNKDAKRIPKDIREKYKAPRRR